MSKDPERSRKDPGKIQERSMKDPGEVQERSCREADNIEGSIKKFWRRFLEKVSREGF